MDWIIFGRGPITVSEPFPEISTVESDVTPPTLDNSADQLNSGMLFDQPLEEENAFALPASAASATLKQIILVYSDHTFEQITPR